MFPIGAMLTLKRRGGLLILSPSPAFRILFALLFALSAFVLFSGVLFNAEPTVLLARNAVPMVLTVLTALALLYDERWIFDAEKRTLETRTGLLMLFRRRRMPLGAVRELRLVSFTKGRAGSPAPRELSRMERAFMPGMARLAVVDAEGAHLVLDTVKAARAEKLKATGRAIAEYCGVPFTEAAG